jgi:hypothetical protein
MDWQQAFYIASTIGMIVITAIGVLYFWLFFNLIKLVKRLTSMIDEGNRIIEDVDYFQKGVRLGVLRFLLKIFEKGDKNE